MMQHGGKKKLFYYGEYLSEASSTPLCTCPVPQPSSDYELLSSASSLALRHLPHVYIVSRSSVDTRVLIPDLIFLVDTPKGHEQRRS